MGIALILGLVFGNLLLKPLIARVRPVSYTHLPAIVPIKTLPMPKPHPKALRQPKPKRKPSQERRFTRV